MSKNEKKANGIYESVTVILEALCIAFLIRTLLFQPFNIPSSSMEPNLLVGDYLFVSKYSYGYSRHSIPFSPPIMKGRIWGAEPKRGDVLVFKKPNDISLDFVKRVVGLPGDIVQLKHGIVHVNGRPFTREKLEQKPETEWSEQYRRLIKFPNVVYYRETNPEGVSYIVREAEGDMGGYDNTREYIVPEGHYFMMGDNRDRSEDSRSSDVSFVPYENLVGRVEILFFSVEPGNAAWQFWRWPWSARWGRIFKSVE